MPYNEPSFHHPANRPATEHSPPDESSFSAPKQPRSRRKLIGFGLLGLMLLILLVIGGMKLLNSKNTTENPGVSNNQPLPTDQSTTAEKDVIDSNKTELYENGFLGIKLTRPETWTATEPESKDSVRLESPVFSYQTMDNKDVSGNFRIYIRKGARAADSKYIGRSVALRPSEKLAYNTPAPGQRTETNLTLFGLDTPDNFALFLIAGNYSLNKGDTLGPNYGKEAETYIIAGGFSSKDLTDDLATNSVSPELLESSNAYKQAVEILKSLQLR